MRPAAAVTLALVACMPAVAPRAHAIPAQVNVEIDWMADGSHSHRPQPAEIAAIVQMFACHNVVLNVVVDDSIPHVTTMIDGPSPGDFFTATGSGRFATMKAQYFDHTGGGWHYCIFGHNYTADGSGTTSSGLGEILGDDFVVTLGSFSGQIGTPFDRASTLAHELGHNLGLGHRATGTTGSGDYPPVYPSIMSYQYQLAGVRNMMLCTGLVDSVTATLLKNIDYSNGRLPTVNENALPEAVGAGIHALDWDCDGSLEAGFVSHDLNGSPWCAAAGPLNVLSDQNDWAVIADSTSAITGAAPRPYETCLTADEVARTLGDPLTCSPSQPALVSEACVGGAMIFVDPGFGGSEQGTGNFPFRTVAAAYSAAPSGSALYLDPGTHTNGGTAMRLTRPLFIAGPGGARVDP